MSFPYPLRIGAPCARSILKVLPLRRLHWMSSSAGSLGYQPLDESTDEIRLLEIDHSAKNIEGKLHYYSCNKVYPKYTTLSYCWGDLKDTSPIKINGGNMDITKNLETALLQLRKQTNSLIWVDALCINQSDKEEKGRQVSRMGDIYSHAIETVAWLGPDDGEEAEAAFNLLRLLSSKQPLSEYEAAVEEVFEPLPMRRKIPRWSAFRTMLRLPYWARIWIIQELAKSSSASIQWGSQKISLITLRKAIHALQKQKPNSLLEDGFRQIANVLWIVEKLQTNHAQSLQEVLSNSCNSLASEPRDKIFAALGISWDGSLIVPKPNYKKPLNIILRDLAMQRLLLDGDQTQVSSMDLICIDNPTTHKPPGFASWATHYPSLWHHKNGAFFSSQITRGLRDGHSACGEPRISVKFSQNGQVLTVSGFFFDHVDDVSVTPKEIKPLNEEPDDGHRPLVQDQPSVQNNPYGDEAGIYEAIWRSLIRNRISKVVEGSITPPPSSIALQFGKMWDIEEIWTESLRKRYYAHMNAIKDFTIHGRTLYDWWMMSSSLHGASPNSEPLLQSLSAEDQEASMVFVGEVARKLITLRYRVLVTRKGYIGLAHAQTQLGDAICLLQGCTVPMILRPCDEGYRVIGEAYVHGIMDGEFWNAQDQSELQIFHLV